MARIELCDLHKSFEDFVAVRDTNLVVNDGSFVVLLGGSGCGKTTTLRMIAGLEIPTSGSILLDDDDVAFRPARERDIAFVFQMFALYPHMNVRANIAFPLRMEGVKRREVRERVLETARLLRIEHLLDRPISGLAGGDRQRVALGRAIVRRPKAFLMDEPLGTLDTEFRDLMCEELRGLHDRIEATTVFVTHDQSEAMNMADVIAVMNEGEILQAASPQEIYHRPASRFVADFLGSPAMNFVDCASAAEADRVTVAGGSLPAPRRLNESTPPEMTLGVRPEHMVVDDHGPLRGQVAGVEYMGTHIILTVDTEVGRVRVRTINTQKERLGDRLGLNYDPGRVVLFDGATDLALPTERATEVAYG